MTSVLLVIHLFITLALIAVVLIQRSEGGGLGVGTTQGMGSFMSGRGTANLLTRTTAILATAFLVLSMALALLNRGTTVGRSSILDLPARPTAPGTQLPALNEPVPPGNAIPPGPAAAAPAPESPVIPAPAAATPPAQAPATPANPAH